MTGVLILAGLILISAALAAAEKRATRWANQTHLPMPGEDE
jgi:hypothetical protein